ncbi:DUF4169 family protein [Thalassospira indica]|uniref:DUF4169 family protein n=1 Tax=Thalassospira indica TaxID=1891279 RepID=A0ABM6Y7K0_9PROT|nr:DUF4169 family protein [Thalassospira indica]AXO16985.1 DUF4169 family protein [Thalassospira indica]
MGDLVNLRQARKRKQRDEKTRKADQNRALHGRTRGERTLTEQERKNADKQHDGHKREKTTAAEDVEHTEGTGNNVVSIFAPDHPSDS